MIRTLRSFIIDKFDWLSESLDFENDESDDESIVRNPLAEIAIGDKICYDLSCETSYQHHGQTRSFKDGFLFCEPEYDKFELCGICVATSGQMSDGLPRFIFPGVENFYSDIRKMPFYACEFGAYALLDKNYERVDDEDIYEWYPDADPENADTDADDFDQYEYDEKIDGYRWEIAEEYADYECLGYLDNIYEYEDDVAKALSDFLGYEHWYGFLNRNAESFRLVKEMNENIFKPWPYRISAPEYYIPSLGELMLVQKNLPSFYDKTDFSDYPLASSNISGDYNVFGLDSVVGAAPKLFSRDSKMTTAPFLHISAELLINAVIKKS